MGRIRENFEVEDKKYWTLFDSGARNTYIAKDIANNFPVFKLRKPEGVNLGGKLHTVLNDCRLEGTINGYDILTHARVLGEIGIDEEGKKIEILLGALTMQEWGIKLNIEEEKLDMSHYPKEFIEF